MSKQFLPSATRVAALLAVSILSAGCGKKAATPPSSNPPSETIVTEPSLTAWQQGDKTTAISKFVDTDWGARPLFASSSPLSLSEDQFQALSEPDRQAKSVAMMSQLEGLKKLGGAVAESGRAAASQGDAAQARKHFTSLKQCGTALDSPDSLRIVQLVGQAFKKLADTELAKLQP